MGEGASCRTKGGKKPPRLPRGEKESWRVLFPVGAGVRTTRGGLIIVRLGPYLHVSEEEGGGGGGVADSEWQVYASHRRRRIYFFALTRYLHFCESGPASQTTTPREKLST